ncbi:protein enabled homolog [Schistocerca piceifrons]|uniref:protein enabled homolog n=1 Tax=Schistocerca piceifrons TaxID=274613 RepID=UPI001F5FB0E0|nr:protein enabled homolog [Schistocerca piceifrons]
MFLPAPLKGSFLGFWYRDLSLSHPRELGERERESKRVRGGGGGRKTNTTSAKGVARDGDVAPAATGSMAPPPPPSPPRRPRRAAALLPPPPPPPPASPTAVAEVAALSDSRQQTADRAAPEAAVCRPAGCGRALGGPPARSGLLRYLRQTAASRAWPRALWSAARAESAANRLRHAASRPE